MAILLWSKTCLSYFTLFCSKYTFNLCSFLVLMLWVIIHNVNSHKNENKLKNISFGSMSPDYWLAVKLQANSELVVLPVRAGQQAVRKHFDLGAEGVNLWFTTSVAELNAHFLNVPLNEWVHREAFAGHFERRGNNKDSVACLESAKKSPSERELKIIELSSCTLDLLSTCYTNSIIRGVKF